MADTIPVLDLVTTTPRQTIRIDGVDYQLKRRDDLTIHDLSQFTRWGVQMEQLEQLEQPTKEQGDQHAELLRKVIDLVVLDAPPAVLGALTLAQLRAVGEVFIALSAPSRRSEMSSNPPAAAPSASTKRSRGSNGSTAATRTRGRGARRSAA